MIKTYEIIEGAKPLQSAHICFSGDPEPAKIVDCVLLSYSQTIKFSSELSTQSALVFECASDLLEEFEVGGYIKISGRKVFRLDYSAPTQSSHAEVIFYCPEGITSSDLTEAMTLSVGSGFQFKEVQKNVYSSPIPIALIEMLGDDDIVIKRVKFKRSTNRADLDQMTMGSVQVLPTKSEVIISEEKSLKDLKITESDAEVMSTNLNSVENCANLTNATENAESSTYLIENSSKLAAAVETIDQMPDCVEKTCLQLLNNGLDNEASRSLIFVLLKQLELEVLMSDGILRAFRNCDVNSSKSIEKFVNLVLTECRPTDLNFIIKNLFQCEQTSNLIEKRDVILLLGSTGVGKTTTIHYMCRSEIEKGLVDNLSHYQIMDCRPDLRVFTTSPRMRSETNAINAVEVDVKHGGVDSMILCDSPGFNDTRGPEVDITNGIGIARAIRKADRIRPILVFSSDSLGARFQNVTEICKTLALFLPSIETDICSFSYLYTKFSEQNVGDFKFKIESRIKELKTTDVEEEAILVDMAKKFDPNGPCILNNLRADPNDVIKKIFEQSSIPSSHFKDFTSLGSKMTLNLQLEKHRSSVKSLLVKVSDGSLDNRDIIRILEVVKYKVSQLWLLAKLVSMSECYHTYQDCHKCLLELARQLRGKFFSKVNNLFDIETQSENTIELQGRESLQILILLDHTNSLITLFPLEDDDDEDDYVGPCIVDLQRKCYECAVSVHVSLEYLTKTILPDFFVDSDPSGSDYGFLRAKLSKLQKLCGTMTEFSIPSARLSDMADNISHTFKAVQSKLATCTSAVELFINEKIIGERKYGDSSLSMHIINQLQSLGDTSNTINYKLLIESTINDNVAASIDTSQFCSNNPDFSDKFVQLFTELKLAETSLVFGADVEFYRSKINILLNEGAMNFIENIKNDFIESRLDYQRFSKIRYKVATMNNLFANNDIRLYCSEKFLDCFSLIEKDANNCREVAILFLETCLKLPSTVMEMPLSWYITSLSDATSFNSFENYFIAFSSKLSTTTYDIARIIGSSVEGQSPNFIEIMWNHYIAATKIFEGLGNISSGSFYDQDSFSQCNILSSELEIVMNKFRRQFEKLKNDSIQFLLNFTPYLSIDDVEKFRVAADFVGACVNVSISIDMDAIFNRIRTTISIAASSFCAFISTIIDTNGSHQDLLPDDFISAYKSIELLRNSCNLRSGGVILSKLCEFLTDYFVAISSALTGAYESVSSKSSVIDRITRDEMYEWRTKAVALSACDDIGASSHRFYHLVAIFNRGIDDVNNICLLEIKAGNFGAAAEKFDAIKNTTGAENDIIFLMQGLETELKNKLKNISDLTTLDAVRDMMILYGAAQMFKGSLSAIFLNDYIEGADGIVSRLKAVLRKLSESLSAMKVCLTTNIFTIERELLTIESIIDQLSGVTVLEISAVDEVREGVQRVRDEIGNSIVTKLNEYFPPTSDENALKFSPEKITTDSPVLIDSKLQEVEKINCLYSLFTQQFEAGLVDGFKTILSSISRVLSSVKSDDSISPDYAESVLEYIDKMHNLLPAAVDAKIHDAIFECKRLFTEKKATLKREREEFAKAKNTNKLITLFYENIQNSAFSDAADCREFINVDFKDICKRAREDIAGGTLIRAYEYIPTFYHNWNKYLSNLNRVNKKLDTAKRYFIRKTKSYDYLKEDKNCFELGNSLLDAVIVYLNSKCIKIFEVKEISKIFRVPDNDVRFKEIITTLQLKDEDKYFSALFDHIKFKLLNLGEFGFVDQNLGDLVKLISKQASYGVQLLELWIEQQYFSVDFDLKFWEHLESLRSGRKLIEIFLEHSNLSTLSTNEPIFSFEMILDKLQLVYDSACKFINVEYLDKEQTRSPQKYVKDDFYSKVNTALQFINILSKSSIHSEFTNIEDMLVNCERHVKKQLELFSKAAKTILETIFQDKNVVDYDRFTMIVENLRSMADNFGVNLREDALTLQESVQIEFNRVLSLRLSTTRLTDAQWLSWKDQVDRVGQVLIELKTVSVHLAFYKSILDKSINATLEAIASHEKGPNFIGALGIHLTYLNDPDANRIITEHEAFENYHQYLFYSKTKNFNIDYVVERIRGHDVNVSVLKRRYQLYDVEYHDIISNASTKGLPYMESIKKRVVELTTLSSLKQLRAKFPTVVANLFSFLTLINTRWYSGSAELQPSLIPHPAQVVALFRIFNADAESVDIVDSSWASMAVESFSKWGGVGESKEVDQSVDVLPNHIAQIPTGEGKSVVLAVTAVIFALRGLDVDCVCFSEYLSKRDQLNFRIFFDAFNVGHKIKYGTFQVLCESFLNQQVNIRDTVASIINSEGIENKPLARRGASALLIDEVDVFFSREFYGNVYTPICPLTGPEIRSLVKFIWSLRDSPMNRTFEHVALSKPFKICLERYEKWEPLISNSVNAMLADLVTYKSHDYKFDSTTCRIGYKDRDNVSFNMMYRYKTLFAYFKEFESGNIDQRSLDGKICLLLNCGIFSYAEVPHLYEHIIGVTGTLETLSDAEKDVIKEFKIEKESIIPSVYGDSKLKEPTDVIVVPADQLHLKLATEISDRRFGSIQNVLRPVLVFFDTQDDLEAFRRSTHIDAIWKIQEMVVDDDSESRDSKMVLAVRMGTVTLLTREFGRGTDFYVDDQQVNATGGLHVIQTFIAKDEAEQKQLCGRTARQGNQGSFSFLLSESSLTNIGLEYGDLRDLKSSERLEIIRNARTKKLSIEHSDTGKDVTRLKSDHEQSQNFVNSLLSRNIDEMKTFLVTRNNYAATTKNVKISRTLCLFDATSSMTNLINKTKRTISVMLERAHKILRAAGCEDSFLLQFAVYRNYYDGDDVLSYSTWENEEANLKLFLENTKAFGGGFKTSNEAIEIALWHANNEAVGELGLSQVILIGDAPANKPNERVVEKKVYRQKHGLNPWDKTKYDFDTDVEMECAKLRSNNIPVHAFHVKIYCKYEFENIAKLTNGTSQPLDVDSERGAEKLTELITTRILSNVGGEEKGSELVKAYHEEFGYV